MLLTALSLLTSEAQAYSFYMAGYGPSISTNVLSLQIPPPDDGSIMNNYGRVVGVGGQYSAWLNKKLRANIDLGFNMGSNYRQSEISVGADQIVYNQRGINAYYGAGLGTGNNFSTDTPLYFIKGQAGFILRKKKTATDISIYAHWMNLTNMTIGAQATYLIGDFTPPNKGGKGKKKKGKKKQGKK
jgi:hypothetical protein